MNSPSGENVDFLNFMRSMKSVSGAAMGVTTVSLAVADHFSTVIPPWPAHAGFIGSAGCVLGVILTFLIRRSGTLATRRAFLTILLASVVVLMAYLLLYAAFVVRLGDAHHDVKGVYLTEEAISAVRSHDAPSRAARDLFAAFGFESGDRIWHLRWLVKWSVFVSFSAGFALLSSTLALLVISGTQPAMTHGEQ